MKNTSVKKNEPRIALVSANFGGIDALHALPQCSDIDSFYYTDQDLESEPASASWTRIIKCNYPRSDFPNRLRAKYFKLQIHRLDEILSYDYIVWADSSVQFKQLNFVLELVERLQNSPPRERLLLIPHPERATVREEYEYVLDRIKAGEEYLRVRYENEKLPEQISYFQSKGWNLDTKLWCGTFWVVENSPIYHAAWDDWWHQNIRWGMQDQLSLPVILENHNLQPQPLNILLWNNEYFRWIRHQLMG